MNLGSTKVFAELELGLRSEVLVSEEYHSALSNQERKLIFLLVTKLVKLKTDYLGTKVRGQVDNFFGGAKQCFLFLVSPGSGVLVLPSFLANVTGEFDSLGPDWVLWVTLGKVNTGLNQTLSSALGERERSAQGVFVYVVVDGDRHLTEMLFEEIGRAHV